MRNFFTTLFIILALGVGAAGAAPAAHAQFDSSTSIDSASTQNAPTTAENAQAASAGATDAAAKTITTPALGQDPGGVFSSVMVFLMGLFAWLLGVAAITLDNAVYYTVVTMGDYVNKLSAIGVAWRILRDLANIMLIFGFLGTGIAIILNVDKYGFSTKLLPKLLVAAVLINFSLFISEAMIDGTNLLATQVYTQINGGQPAGVKNFDLTSVSNEGISNKIMSQLGLATIYSNALSNNTVLQASGATFIGFMSIILFLVAAFVMFSLAFILIARFVALIFLILVSPVAIMGWALPMMEYRAKQWWDNFLQQIITAPVLLLLLYVALMVITDANFLGFGPTENVAGGWTGFVPNADGSTNFTGFASMILSFLVAMGLLMVVVIKAKSMSAFGAKGATKLASHLSGATLLAAGAGRGTNYIGRNTLGRAGNTRIGKALGMGGLANKSFDVRNAGLFKSAKQYTGLDLGAGQKGGYKATYDAKVKSETAKRNKENTKQVEQNRQTTERSYNEARAEHNTAAAEHAKQKAEVERLEEETKDVPAWEMTPENLNKLDVARQNLAASEEKLKAASIRVEEAGATHGKSVEEERRTKDEISKMKERSEIDELRTKVKEMADKSEKETGKKENEKKEPKKEEKKEEKK